MKTHKSCFNLIPITLMRLPQRFVGGPLPSRRPPLGRRPHYPLVCYPSKKIRDAAPAYLYIRTTQVYSMYVVFGGKNTDWNLGKYKVCYTYFLLIISVPLQEVLPEGGTAPEGRRVQHHQISHLLFPGGHGNGGK